MLVGQPKVVPQPELGLWSSGVIGLLILVILFLMGKI
ncbi:hypothetical protein NTGBS_150026 [Candidatus Nitrotoga sp. BS]|nr:hypothetical protein NTGBS_150026 [Candidatus Nitrotoga sp. BS]